MENTTEEETILNYGTLKLKATPVEGVCSEESCDREATNQEYNLCTKHYRHLPHIKQQNREYDKAYYLANAEKRKATAREWYLKNKASKQTPV